MRLRNQSRAFSASVWIWIFHLGFFVFLLRRFISIRSVFAKLFHHTQRVRDEIVVAPESPAQRKRARQAFAKRGAFLCEILPREISGLEFFSCVVDRTVDTLVKTRPVRIHELFKQVFSIRKRAEHISSITPSREQQLRQRQRRVYFLRVPRRDGAIKLEFRGGGCGCCVFDIVRAPLHSPGDATSDPLPHLWDVVHLPNQSWCVHQSGEEDLREVKLGHALTRHARVEPQVEERTRVCFFEFVQPLSRLHPLVQIKQAHREFRG
mmetsp:Transcript_12608/g.47126  ORF Transcript_12608/g.47126 Transcript_12608/m.47126 type:complete len:265 (+) Transcript_12608:2625-3419(+)